MAGTALVPPPTQGNGSRHNGMIGSRSPRILQIVALVAGLLLATDSAIRLETTSSGGVDVHSGAMFLLGEPATVRNPGQQLATFVVARSATTESAKTRAVDQSGLDPALSDAWHHYGCHLKRSLWADSRAKERKRS